MDMDGFFLHKFCMHDDVQYKGDMHALPMLKISFNYGSYSEWKLIFEIHWVRVMVHKALFVCYHTCIQVSAAIPYRLVKTFSNEAINERYGSRLLCLRELKKQKLSKKCINRISCILLFKN